MASTSVFESKLHPLEGRGRKSAREQDSGSAEVLRCAGKGPARIVKLRFHRYRESVASAWRLLEVPAHDLPPAGRSARLNLTRWNVVAVVHES